MQTPLPKESKPLLAYFAAVLVIFIWSGWFIVSRYGVVSEFTPMDITALRFWTAAIATSPLWFFYNWRNVSIIRAVIVALGCGIPYTLLCFYGLQSAKAASGGVLVNGLLPVFGALMAVVLLKTTINRLAWIGIALAVTANVLMAAQGLRLESLNMQLLMGLFLLACAAIVFATYMTAVRMFGMSLKDIIVLVPLVNALLCVPLWLVSDSKLDELPVTEIAFQMLYQGIIVSVGALLLITYQVQKLGPTTTSVFMAFVPSMTALMGVIFLGELLSTIEMTSLLLCTLGLVIYARSQSVSVKRP